MKVRLGFVSNSSSSSFIVIQKNVKELNEELIKHNKKMLKDYCDGDYANDRIDEFKDSKIIAIGSIGYESEGDSINEIVKNIVKGLGFNPKDFDVITED
jgi:hypothetical protein